MRIKKCEIVMAAVLVLVFVIGRSAQEVQSELADKVIRLHVIANSDSVEDQVQKLMVRDAVLTRIRGMIEGCGTRDDALCTISDHMGEITAEARRVLDESGSGLVAETALDIEDYPTREYGAFALPAGRYMSLKVTIGDGGGRNWWCVLFPSLCTSAALALPDGFDDGDVSLITRDGAEYVIKFRIIELLADIRGLFE